MRLMRSKREIIVFSIKPTIERPAAGSHPNICPSRNLHEGKARVNKLVKEIMV